MRRKDKEITDKSLIDEILGTNNICRIALSSENEPYIVSMNYGYHDGYLYLHSANHGKKLDVIKKNNKVCFEISDSIEIVHSDIACKFGTKYRSLVGNGKISILTDEEEKKRGLLVIMNQITSKSDWTIPLNVIENISVLKIKIENLTGKKSGL